MTLTSDEARSLVQRVGVERPEVLELARVLSLAVQIDPALLRRARRTLVPGAGAATEAELWFSPLVEARSNEGIELEPHVSDLLRDELRLQPERLDSVWTCIQSMRRDLPDLLRLEEELTYLGLQSPRPVETIRKHLASVYRAVHEEQRTGAAAWAVRAIPNLPEGVRTEEVAQQLVLASRLVLQAAEGASSFSGEGVADWVNLLTVGDGDPVQVGLSLRGTKLVVTEPPEGEVLFELPPTQPLALEASWESPDGRRVALLLPRLGASVETEVGLDHLRLRVAGGATWDVDVLGVRSLVTDESVYSVDALVVLESAKQRDAVLSAFESSDLEVEREQVADGHVLTAVQPRGPVHFAVHVVPSDGPAHSARRVRELVGRFSPELLCLGGTCAALSGDLQVGDLFIASEVLTQRLGEGVDVGVTSTRFDWQALIEAIHKSRLSSSKWASLEGPNEPARPRLGRLAVAPPAVASAASGLESLRADAVGLLPIPFEPAGSLPPTLVVMLVTSAASESKGPPVGSGALGHFFADLVSHLPRTFATGPTISGARGLVEIRGTSGVAHALAWDLAGRRIGAAADGLLTLWSTAGGEPVGKMPLEADVDHIGWLAGADELVVAGPNHLAVGHLSSGTWRQAPQAVEGKVAALATAPATKRLAAAFVRSDGERYLVTWQPSRPDSYAYSSRPGSALAWSPRDDRLFAATDEGRLLAFGSSFESPLVETSAPEGISALAASSEALAAGTQHGAVWLRRSQEERFHPLGDAPEGVVRLAFVPGEPLLVVRTARQLVVMSTESGSLVMKLPLGAGGGFAVHPRLPRLAVSGEQGGITIWELDVQRLQELARASLRDEDIDALARHVADAARADDVEKVAHLARRLEAAVLASSGDLSDKELVSLLRALRGADTFIRWGLRIGEALDRVHGPPRARLQYVQLLIAQDDLAGARAVLDRLGEELPTELRAEVIATKGRIEEIQYLRKRPFDPTRLAAAIEHYQAAIVASEAILPWAGVKLLGLQRHGERHRVELPGEIDVEKLAHSILERTEAGDGGGSSTIWDCAVAVEAALAIGDLDRARSWLDRFVRSPEADASELETVWNRLTQVWDLAADTESGASLLPLLARPLADQTGDAAWLERAGIAQEAPSGDADPGSRREPESSEIEQLSGAVGFVVVGGTTRCAGFLVSGTSFDRSFGPSPLLVVPTHALLRNPGAAEHGALAPEFDPRKVEATFSPEPSDSQTSSTCHEVVWSSPKSVLDVTLLRLEGLPPRVGTLRLVPEFRGAGAQRIVGYTKEGDLTSAEITVIAATDRSCEYECEDEHYLSGSPLLSADHRVVGMHRVQTTGTRVYGAVLMEAVRSAIRGSLSSAAGEPRIFVSSANSDREWIERVSKQLRALGARVVTSFDMPSEASASEWIRSRIEDCDRVVVLVSDASVQSEFVRAEVDLALAQGIPVTPLLLEKSALPDLPESWRHLHVVEFDALAGILEESPPNAEMPGAEPPILFISHSEMDHEWGEPIATYLETELEGIARVWFHPWERQPEDHWSQTAKGALRRARWFVVLLSPSYLESEECLEEAGMIRDAIGEESHRPIPVTLRQIDRKRVREALGPMPAPLDASRLDSLKDPNRALKRLARKIRARIEKTSPAKRSKRRK